MPYGIPRVACCASLNLWTAHQINAMNALLAFSGMCLLPLSAYLTSELFIHTPHLFYAALGAVLNRAYKNMLVTVYQTIFSK